MKLLRRRVSQRNKVAQKGKCEYCDQDIVRTNPRQLWRATSGALALHDAEYCAEAKEKGAKTNGHRLAVS